VEWQLQGVVAHKRLASLHITLCIRNSLPDLPNMSGIHAHPSSTPSRQTMRVAAGKPSNDEAGFRSRVTMRTAMTFGHQFQ
jgi:hypothetical protein